MAYPAETSLHDIGAIGQSQVEGSIVPGRREIVDTPVACASDGKDVQTRNGFAPIGHDTVDRFVIKQRPYCRRVGPHIDQSQRL